MELDLSSVGEEYQFKKHVFNLKTHRVDGLILQIHHSYSDSAGEIKKYRFLFASFNDYGTQLAISDHKGNVFIIDLEMEKYWQLPNVGLTSLISFPPLKKQELLVSVDSNSILFIHIETGEMTGVLKGHSAPATEISYSDDGYYYLTSCTTEAIVWDSTTCNQIHRLSLKSEASLKKVLFMPVTNHILACFQNDTMHIWKFGTFECVKQIVPETWKTHHLKSIALTKDGRAMVIAGHSPNIVIFCLHSWTIMKVVEFPEYISGIKQMEFLSQAFDGGANKILVMLTTSLEIFFFNIETSVFLKGMYQIFGTAVKFGLSCNGKYLASILTTGEINIYLIDKILSNKKHVASDINFSRITKNDNNVIPSRNFSNNSKRTIKSVESLSSIQKQFHSKKEEKLKVKLTEENKNKTKNIMIKEILDVKKLLPILKQFGEYPESYRALIWKTILQIPVNQEAFVSLSLKKCHPSYIKLESKYPLVNTTLCNSLKKLLSNLSHWCPLFGEVEFLPEFVFPFVKLYHSDPLASFEVVATIIVNWCQNWFEFFPFPPINLLTVMENILGYHDPDLLEFFIKQNITTSVFVCLLFHTVFSKVLSKNEWLKLWDHILSNEPSFLFMAIIAYNVVCRNAITAFETVSDVEKFFHRQNPVDMKMLISKTYKYLKETPKDIHCRQFFVSFRPLREGGTYTSFLAYPKLILDSSAERLQSIRKEEEEILEQQLQALSIKKKLDKRLKKKNSSEEQEKIYRDLEERIRDTVEKEEDRILAQRQKLQNLKQELRLKELEVLENTRDKVLKERLKKKEMEFERLLQDISKKKAREKMQIDMIEEEIRKYHSELLLRKCQLELELGFTCNEDDIDGALNAQRKRFSSDLLDLQSEWDSLHHDKRIEFSKKMAAIKGLIQDLEVEVSKEVAEKHSEKQSQQKREYINELKKKVKILENEIEELLVQNLNRLKSMKEDKKTIVLFPKQKSQINGESEELEIKIRSSTISTDSSISKEESIKNTALSKNHKTVPKKCSSWNRKTTTKIPKTKSRSIKTEEPKRSRVKINSKTRTSTQPSKHLKSKFTVPHRSVILKSDLPISDDKSSGTFEKSSDNESCFEKKKLRQRPTGDFSSKAILREGYERRKFRTDEKPMTESNFTVQKGTSSESSESEVKIVKTAFKARKQLIEQAKLRQNMT